jgi:hypothetical protein
MDESVAREMESDPRFPSGRWTGFFLQRLIPGRHQMELILTFRDGQMSGEGRDWVGEFVIRGKYDTADGRCHWSKRYVGRHDVYYEGFNEGKGIWGHWEIAATREYPRQHGGFHIWPEGMAEPTGQVLHEEAEAPVEPPVEPVRKEEREFEPACA